MRRVMMLAVVLITAWLALGLSAAAEVPHLIRYQGHAVDARGVPLEGPYTLTFRLYDAETGGTMLWEERQDGVSISQGHFSVLLGQVRPLQGVVDWTTPCWLSVQVNAEPELSPRQRITSVPMALRAGVAEMALNLRTSSLQDDTSSLVPAGAIILWDGAGCPAGYARVTALDGRFLVADATYNAAAGGSNAKDLSHTHGPGSYAGPSHTHGDSHGHDVLGNVRGAGSLCSNDGGEGCQTINQSVTTTDAGGAGAVTGTSAAGGSASVDIRPAYATILLCKKD